MDKTVSEFLKRWNDDDCVALFSDKTASQFFKSETVFLDNIHQEIGSILDIGCASGRFIELLNSYKVNPKFVGLDISQKNIENAKTLYPDSEFIFTDALDYNPDRKFSLVNATGVCQHEPRFELLIKQMCSLSDKYVLFDLKLANVTSHVIDIEKSYTGKSHRLYFNLHSLEQLLGFLKSIEGIKSIQMFGYKTPLNDRTIVPENIDEVVSTGVLLTMSDCQDGIGNVNVKLELPEFI